MTEIKPGTYIHSQTLTEVTLPSKEHIGDARSRVFRGLAMATIEFVCSAVRFMAIIQNH